jgi:hypothetical protein
MLQRSSGYTIPHRRPVMHSSVTPHIEFTRDRLQTVIKRSEMITSLLDNAEYLEDIEGALKSLEATKKDLLRAISSLKTAETNWDPASTV